VAGTEVKLTADASQLVQEVRKAETALKGLQDVGANVSKALIGVTAAAAGFGYAVKGILDSAAALFDAADTIGISVQSLQVFQKAAGEVGVSAEELNSSLMKMNANIGEALIKGSGGAADALKRMGISLDQINGMKPDAQFELIAKRLSEIPNQAERSALAMDLFGKQGAKVLKIAEGLDEMRKKMEALGMLISPEQQASLDLAGDAVDGLIGMFSVGLKKAVADMAPYILAIVYSIEDAVKAAGGLENIISKVGAVVRYAFNVAIIYGMVNGFIAMQAAIRAAGGAMAVFNLIVQRSPLFLLVAAAAALAQAFGLDVAGAIGKALDVSGNLGKANDKIAETAGEIKDKNNEAAVAAKRGNAEAEKAAANALKALDNTIKKLESENQFMKDKVGLSEQEAAVQKIIRDEQDKLAAAGAKMSANQLARLTAAAQESQELKAQAAFTDTMKALQDDILSLTAAEGIEREKISALLGLEKSMKREATQGEKDKLNALIQQREVLKSISQQQQDFVRNYDSDLQIFIGRNEKLINLDKQRAKAKENLDKVTGENEKKLALENLQAIEGRYTGELLAAAGAYSELYSLETNYNKQLGALRDIRDRLEKDSLMYRLMESEGVLKEMELQEKRMQERLAVEKQAFEIRNAQMEKATRLSNLQIIQNAELEAARTKYANLEVLAFEHQQALKDIEIKAQQDKLAMQLQQGNAEYQYRRFSADEAKQIAADRTAFEKKTEMEKTGFVLDQAGQMFSALGAQNKSAFEAAKAFNIANAIMNTYMAATKALATYPPPFNFIAMGAAVAMGLAQVAQIRSQQYSGRALGGPVMGGTPYLVGENGPEIFTPATTGSITRNSDIGGSSTVNVSFNITANDTSGFDSLLVARRGLITEIIRDAQLDKGRRI